MGRARRRPVLRRDRRGSRPALCAEVAVTHPEAGRRSTGKPRCSKCNDTGMIALRSRDGAYAFPGPVPDDAKGYIDANCWYCDSGPPPPSEQAPALVEVEEAARRIIARADGGRPIWEQQDEDAETVARALLSRREEEEHKATKDICNSVDASVPRRSSKPKARS